MNPALWENWKYLFGLKGFIVNSQMRHCHSSENGVCSLTSASHTEPCCAHVSVYVCVCVYTNTEPDS